MSPRSSPNLVRAVATLLAAAASVASTATATESPAQQPPAQQPSAKQSPAQQTPGAKVAPAKPVERLTAWPAPANKDALLVDIEKLCKARTPEMASQAHESLVAAGAASVPFLLDRFGREHDEDASKRVREVLGEVTDAPQTRLLAKEFESKFQPVRSFVLWRAAAFPDPEIRAAAETAWKRIEKAGAKADPDERYAAALCASSTGSLLGLSMLQEAAGKNWDRRGVEIRSALEGIRGPDATKQVLERLKDADQRQKVAILHLLAGCGDKTALFTVKGFLDDDDNQLRVAAINACRGIVDRDPPQEQLPVFEAIEIAKKWKEKI